MTTVSWLPDTGRRYPEVTPTNRTSSPIPPPLPRRDRAVTGELPAPFAESLIDYLPSSVAWWRDRWVIATNAWGGRSLASFEPGSGWHRLNTPPGWARRPMTAHGAELGCVVHDPAADYGRFDTLRNGRWTTLRADLETSAVVDFDGSQVAVRDLAGHAAALGPRQETISVRGSTLVGGVGAEAWEIPLPYGCTVTLLSCSPSREQVLAVLRSGSRYQAHVFRTRDGSSASASSCHDVLQPSAAWIDEDTVVLVRERWPSLEPFRWDVRHGTSHDVWARGAVGTVRSLARSSSGLIACAGSTYDTPRRLFLLDDPGFGQAAPAGSAYTVVVDNEGQPVPCVVHEPRTAPKATCLIFPGGPHEPVWAEFSSLPESLAALGWRVVKVNVRSSGLREAAYRPHAPYVYGVDDVSDACRVWDALASGPVVTLGMSYGAYMASSAAELRNGAGAVILAGFVSPCDIRDSDHNGVREFGAYAFGSRLTGARRRLTVPHFFSHGRHDRRIPLDAVHAYLDDPQVTYLPLPDEGHGIHTDDAARAVYPPVLAWMEEMVS